MKETIPGQIDLIADIVETLLVPGKLIYKILTAIVSLADCERAVAFVMAPGNRFEPKAQVGVSANNLNTIRDVLNSYASEHPRSSSLVYLPDTRKDEKFRKISILKGADILSFACVPLKLEGESYGVLYLDSTSHTRILSSMDMERINRYSRLITLAILREQKLGDAEFNIATVSVNDYLAERTIDELERQQLQSLLEKSNWNVTKTAQLMQMPRRTLYNKMTKYGIKRPKRGRHEAAAVV